MNDHDYDEAQRLAIQVLAGVTCKFVLELHTLRAELRAVRRQLRRRRARRAR